MSSTSPAACGAGVSAERQEIDRGLNTAAVVDGVEAIRQSWVDRSAALRNAHQAVALDLAYGRSERERLDLFASGQRDAPTLLFFHGGFWRRNSKSEFSFVAAGPLARGFNVAVVGYTLAPAISVRGIVEQAWQSASWLRERRATLGLGAGPLYAIGWSAGGHLAAMLATHPDVSASIALSGLFDLEPIRRSSYNDTLGLTESDVAAVSPILNLSPAWHPSGRAVVHSVLTDRGNQQIVARGPIGRLNVPSGQRQDRHDAHRGSDAASSSPAPVS